MPLIILIVVPLVLVVVMIRAFVRNAITLKRDVDRRFDDFRARLESEANSTLDVFLKANSVKDNSN